MPEMKSPTIAPCAPVYSFEDLFQRQIEVTGYLEHLLYLFNRRLPKARTPRQQTLICMHKLLSSMELMEDLDSVTQQIDAERKEADKRGLSDDVQFLNPIPHPPPQPQQHPQPQQQQQLDPNENLVIDTIHGALQAEFDGLFDELNETHHQ